jgi:hypothetical protein
MNADLGPQVAADMAQFISGRIKPGDGPVQVEQPDGDEAVGPNLLADLQSEGFTIVRFGGKHRIRYAAKALAGDVIARVSVDGADGARMYRNKPMIGLTPLGPFTVMRRGG